MSSSYRAPERLTTTTYLDRHEPYSYKQQSNSYWKSPPSDTCDEDRISRSSYNGQHEKVGRWAGGGSQQAVCYPRSNSRYLSRFDAESEKSCDWREQREQSAYQFSPFTQQYVSPLQRSQGRAAEQWPQRLNTWTAINQDQLPQSQPKRGFFDPNVAPFVPQHNQRAATSYEKRDELPQQQNSSGMTRSTAINITQNDDILHPTLERKTATTTKQAALLAKNHALAELLSPSFRTVGSGAAQTKGPLQTKDRPQPRGRPQIKDPLQTKGNPRLYLIPRPSPSTTYLERANEAPALLDSPRQLLVILDLNGTLLARVNRSATFVRRPRVHEFLEYLFSHHKIMVWSSARPENVQAMCAQLFTPQQRRQLTGVWARDMLRLGPHYNAKVQVYKTLAWVWDNPAIQATAVRPSLTWAQHNTVLIDDSLEKAASEPFNLIEVDEFERRAEQMQYDVLGQVVLYLETLRWQANVSALMRTSPFRFDALREDVQWSTIP